MIKDLEKIRRKGRSEKHQKEIVAEEPRPRIDPGIYEAICYDMNVRPCHGGVLKVFLQFRILGGEYDETEFFLCCSKPRNKLRERLKLHKQMCLALGRPLRKGERLSKEIFANKLYRVLVRYTFRKFDDTNQIMPDYMQYSVIGTILEVLTGVPDES